MVFLWFHIVTGESMVSTPFNPLRQAASQAASQAMAPGELQLSYESDCVVVRAGAWCFFHHSGSITPLASPFTVVSSD